MAQKYGYLDTLFNKIIADAPSSAELGTQGMSTYNDLQEWYEALDTIDQVDQMVIAINNLEQLDPLLDMVTETGTDMIKTEYYSRASFKKGAWDTMGKSSKPTLQEFAIPYDEYDCSVAVDKKLLMKERQSIVDRLIGDVFDAYMRVIREIKITALLTLPSEEDRKIPCFWRDTSGFSATNQLKPHANGLETFTTAETHYLGQATYDDKIVTTLTDKIESKGYGANGSIIVATQESWDKYNEQFTYEDVRRLEIQNASMDFKVDPNKPNLVAMPKSVFPKDYFLCYDPNVRFLYMKEANNESMRGLVRDFTTMDEVRTSSRADFNVYETGAGIVEKGAGAVLYVGNASYVNPTLNYQ